MNEPYPLSCPDVPASQIFRAKDVRKSGMLRKKAGGFKFTLIQNPYDHRFVIIHKGWVYYYKNEKSEKQQGKFSLEGYSSNVVNAEEEEAKIQHVFKVYGKSAGTRIWYFAAENEMEKREWMEAFRLEIEQYKFAASSIKCSSSSPYPRSGGTHTSVNERPKSINIPDGSFKQMQRSPLTNFTSSATIDTGFSSMGSLDPEDDYEPVSINDADLYDDDDEFDTDSNEDDYENPFTQPMDVVNKNVPKPIFPHEDPPGIAPPVPKRDPVTELLKRSDSIALAAELELHRKSHGHISSSPQYFFGNTSTGPNSRRFPSDDRVPKVSHNHTRPPPPVPLKPSPSHYLSMSPTGSSPTFAKRPVPPSLRINPAHKNLKSPGLKFSPQPGHSCQSTIPSFSKHQSTDDTVRGSSTSKGAATATWLIGTKPMQRPISDAFALGGKFGQQKFTSEQTNRHSADITHISRGQSKLDRQWDRYGRDDPSLSGALEENTPSDAHSEYKFDLSHTSTSTAPNVIEADINPQQCIQQKTDLICEPPPLVDNNLLIEFLERLSECGISTPAEVCVKPPLSPKNYFGVAVLAKQNGDANLQKHVSGYFSENFETVLSSDSLKLLKLQNFKKYLKASDLQDFEKLRMVDAKLCGVEENDTDREIIKVASVLSAAYRTKYRALTARCHSFLQRQLSDSNCLETANFAKQYKLDELKIWAEYHVIVNFNSILTNIFTGAYPEEEILQFCKISSIPVHMCATMQNKSASTTLPMQSDLQTLASKWLMFQLRKLSSINTQTIGSKGGTINHDGCCVTFPEGALSKDTDIIMTINDNPANYPQIGMTITPILCIEPSMTLKKPVTVRMQTCFRSYDGQTVVAHIFTDQGSGWELDQDIWLCSNYEITFCLGHFSGSVATVNDNTSGKFIFYNSIYIRRVTGLITSCFYSSKKRERDIKKGRRESNCSSFCPHPLTIEGEKGQLVKLKITLDEPESQPPITMEHEQWRPYVFPIQKIHERGELFSSTRPGSKVTSLKAGSFVSGIYEVSVGDLKEIALVDREWPVTLDPEIKDPSVVTVIGKQVKDGGIFNEDNKDCQMNVNGMPI